MSEFLPLPLPVQTQAGPPLCFPTSCVHNTVTTVAENQPTKRHQKSPRAGEEPRPQQTVLRLHGTQTCISSTKAPPLHTRHTSSLCRLSKPNARPRSVTTRYGPQLTERAAVPENSPSMARKSASSTASYTLLRLSLKSAARGKSTPEATGRGRPPRSARVQPSFPPAAQAGPQAREQRGRPASLRRRPEPAAGPGGGSGVTGEHRARLGARSRSLTASDHLHPSPAPARPEPGAQPPPPSASGTGPAPPRPAPPLLSSPARPREALPSCRGRSRS